MKTVLFSLLATVTFFSYSSLAAPSKLVMGSEFVCLLDNTGATDCWGQNRRGQMSFPQPVEGQPYITKIASSTSDKLTFGVDIGSCALFSDKKIACYGNAFLNVKVDQDDYVDLAVGDLHLCGLNTSGQIKCFGNNASKQLNVPSEAMPARAVLAADSASCAITLDDKLVCWGQGKVPADLGAITTAVASNSSVCVIRKADAAIQCWGRWTKTLDSARFKSVVVNLDNICGLTEADDVLCGYPGFPLSDSQFPTKATDLAAATVNFCATSFDGKTYCTASMLQPVALGFAGNTLTNIDAFEWISSGWFTFGGMFKVKNQNRRLFASVYSDYIDAFDIDAKQVLGNGYTFCHWHHDNTLTCEYEGDEGYLPPEIKGQKLKAVSAFENMHVCAITEADIPVCWNAYLLTDDPADYPCRHGACDIPADFGKIIQISAGDQHTCAVNDERKVRCWGSNALGESDVPTLPEVAEVYAGRNVSCAILLADGGVRCWGNNAYGMNTPPAGLIGVTQLIASRVAFSTSGLPLGSHLCALTQIGEVKCWGNNYFGQLDVPTNLPTIKSIFAGILTTCAVDETDRAHCWGMFRSTANPNVSVVNNVVESAPSPLRAATKPGKGF